MPEVKKLPKLPIRSLETHKNQCGRILIIAGSRGFTGAGALATKAALRSGAGLVTWAIPESLLAIAETLCLESITMPLAETEQMAPSVAAREPLLEAAQESDIVVLGPGLPVAGESGELMRLLIPEIKCPLILDAGALRAVSTNMLAIRNRRYPTILTPHPGEFAELTNLNITEIQENRIGHTQELAVKSEATVLLKGAGTIVSNGEDYFVNPTGNPAMATAGMGDVLSGIIAAIATITDDHFTATCIGAYLHGAAGDKAAQKNGNGLIASDLLKELPVALEEFNK